MFSQVLVAAVLASPLFMQAVFALDSTDDSCIRTYTVQEGDYCDTISVSQNVSTFQLAYLNSAIDANCSNLYINETLCLGLTGEDCTSTYVVGTNDTCESISNSTGVNTTMIYFNNPQIDDECSNIYLSEVLCVSDVAYTYSNESVASTTASGAAVSSTKAVVSTASIASFAAVPTSASSSTVSVVTLTSSYSASSASASSTYYDDESYADEDDDGDEDNSDIPYCGEI